MMHHSNSKASQRGFTLMEIMLVLLLLGLATSVVVPNIMPGNGSAELRRTAERFAALVETAHEEAILGGRDLGIVINDNEYRFVRFGKDGWEPINNDRLLQPITLEDGFTLTFTPGESVWHSTLQQQQDDTLLEDWFKKPEEMQDPNLYIWSSGDMTPAEIAFSIQPLTNSRRNNSRQPSFSVRVEESGEVYFVEDNQS